MKCEQVIRQIEENVHQDNLPTEDSKNKMGGQVEEIVTAESSKNNQIKFPVVTQNNSLGARKDDNVNKQKSALEIFGTNLTKLAQEV